MPVQISNEVLICRIEEYMRGSQNPDFLGYRDQTLARDFADKDRFVWFLRLLSALGGYEGKRILDVGCGFGWHAFAIAILGKNDVVGLDILPSMTAGMNDCIDHMRLKGIDFKLTAANGDICTAEFPPNSFDSIYSTEAIEHVHDMDAMVDRCSAIIKPGGSLILINDQNVLNKKGRRETIEMWHKRESSWEWSNYLRRIRPIEHRDAKPFAVRREEIIRAANPSLANDTVAKIVSATAGLRTPEIENIAMEYRPGSALPVPHELDWCRNPDTGEYAERLFDPFALAEMMRRGGFKTQVRHMFRRTPLNFFNGVQFRPLNTLLFNVRPVFVVFGRKR